MSELPPALRERVLASRAATPGTSPGTWERRRLGALAVVVAWTIAGIAYWEMREDWKLLPGWYRTASLVLTGGTGTGLLLLGFLRGRYLTGPPVGLVRALSVLFPLMTLAWVVLFAYPTTPPGNWMAEATSSIHCHAIAVLTALPPLGALFWLRRGLTLPAPGLLGACLGASLAAWSQVVLFASCPMGGPIHASLGHVMPSLPLMGIGALVGLRAFR